MLELASSVSCREPPVIRSSFLRQLGIYKGIICSQSYARRALASLGFFEIALCTICHLQLLYPSNMHSGLKHLFLFVTAVASSPFQIFDKRNACDWKDAEPVLYHEYGTDACPPRVALNEDGSCPVRSYKPGLFQPSGCAGFCENRTTYSYGRESIFLANPYCHGYGQKAATCSISETQTTTASLSFSVPATVKFTDTLSAGVSGGYTRTWSHAIAQTKSISLGEGECGYWTFLPIVKETW